MESTDRGILLEISGRLLRIEGSQGRTEERIAVIEKRLDVLEMELRHQGDRIEWLQTTVYWGFALLGVIAAVVPLLRRDVQAVGQPPQIIMCPPQVPEVVVRMDAVERKDS